MSDNTQLNSSTTTGDVISTEDVGGGVKIQRMKLVSGAHSVDGGNISLSNPFPVGAVDPLGASTLIASDDSVKLLRRLCDLCETIATQDAQNRQKICIDAISGALTLAAVTTVSNVTTCSTVTTVSTVTTCSTVTTVNQIAGYPAQWNLMDQARNAYANGIRRLLV